MTVPRIAITAGEPAGIGPDVVLMASRESWQAELVVVADPELLEERASALGITVELLPLDESATPVPTAAGTLRIQPVSLRTPSQPGQLDPAAPSIHSTFVYAPGPGG